MAKSGVRVTKDKTRDLFKAISALTRKDVLVGVPEEAPDRRGEGISNAALAYIHQFGAPAANIPARPFLYEGIEDAQEKIVGQLGKGGKAALDGDSAGVDKALNSAGLVAQNSVKARINEGDFTPLAPSTVAARKRKGDDDPKPLVDTGQLRNSITYVVVDNKGK